MEKQTVLKNQIINVELFESDSTTSTKLKSFKRCVYVSANDICKGVAKTPLHNFYVDVVLQEDETWLHAIEQEDKDYRHHEIYEKTCPTIEKKEAYAVFLGRACWYPSNGEENGNNRPMYPEYTVESSIDSTKSSEEKALSEAITSADTTGVTMYVTRIHSSGMCVVLNDVGLDELDKHNTLLYVVNPLYTENEELASYIENMTCYMLDIQKDQKETEKFNLALRLLETNEEEETITKEAISAFKSFCNESHTVDRLASQYAKLFSPRISVGYASRVAYERLCSFTEMIPFIKSMEMLGELETELSRQLIARYGYNPEKDWLAWATGKEVKDCLEQSIQLSIINVFDNFMSVRAGKASYKYSMVEVENDDCEVTTVWGPDSLNTVGSHI